MVRLLGLSPLSVTEYLTLPFTSFLVVAHDKIIGYQCADSRPWLSFRRVIVRFPERLLTCIHDCWFGPLVDGSELEYVASCMGFQNSADIDCNRCDSEECWLFYRLDSGTVHNAPTMVVEKGRQDAISSLITKCELT